MQHETTILQVDSGSFDTGSLYNMLNYGSPLGPLIFFLYIFFIFPLKSENLKIIINELYIYSTNLNIIG